MSDAPEVDLSGGLDAIEELILGEAPHLNRVQVAEQAGVPLDVARELWRLLGFPEQDDDDVAFTEADVEALRYSHDLMKLGILSPERQAALVRTWGRSFARLAEWQTRLLTEVALETRRPGRPDHLADRGGAAAAGDAAELRVAPAPRQGVAPDADHRLARAPTSPASPSASSTSSASPRAARR